jgi:hypothetical protein
VDVRFDAEGRPLSPDKTERVQSWVRLAMFPLGMLLLGAGWASIHLVLAPSPPLTHASAPPMPADAPIPAASPIVVQFPDVLTVITPIPEASPEPTPTYAMATVPPAVICGNWVRPGDVCQMRDAPLPTPTPVKPCPQRPKTECVWTGDPDDATPMAPPTAQYGTNTK